MERSVIGSRQRRASSNAQKLRLGDFNIETQSRAETPTRSIMGVKTRLKECSNALTTSKELLKIINRMWNQEDRPSSSTSLVSALHSELERARFQINQLIHEHNKPENNDIIQRFYDEKASWRTNEQEVVEAAIESVAGELEVERKLRRRFERLNKKLGKELAETKTEVEEMRRESFKVKEEVEKEREMLQLADALREERVVMMKLSEAKHLLEEKNTAVDKVKNNLQTYLKAERCKEKKLRNQESEEYLNYNHVEDENEEDDLHSIELNVVDNKSYKWPYGEDNNNRGRSISDWVVQSEKLQKGGGDTVGYLDDTEAYKPNKAYLKDHRLLSGPRLSNFRGGSVQQSRLLDADKGDNQSGRRSRW